KQLEKMNTTESERATTIRQMESDQDRLNQRIYELDAEIRQNQNVLNLTALEVDRSENRIAFNRQRAQELAGRHAQLSEELAQATAQAAAWETRSATQVQTVTRLREESGVLNGRVEELLQRAEQRTKKIGDTEGQIEALRLRASEAGESLLQLHGEQKQAEEALVHQTEALRKLEANEHEVLETSMKARDDAERAALELEGSSGELAALKKNAEELQAKIGEVRGRRENMGKEAEALRDSLASMKARHSTLTQILQDRSYTADAVQKLVAANERGGGHEFRAVGVLADYAEVEEKHEAAVEQYLRDELEYVVVETYDHARAGVSMLRDEVGGRATFFVD